MPNPTTEQLAAVDLFSKGRTLAIEAGAGAGKTSTLVLLARSTSRRGQYMAFNKTIVEEAKEKMPTTVRCNTAHSLAYGAVGYRYKARLGSSRIKSMEAARLLGISEIKITVGTESRRLSPGWLAGLVNRSIAAFCNSADPLPTSEHVPYVDGIDLPLADGRRGRDNNREVATRLVPYLRRAWADLNDPAGRLRFTPDHYLKIWQLGTPVIRAEFILVDEAQDLSPVMLDIVQRQKAQIVWVGDSQQQIYDWRGAVNALASVDSESRAFLTRSFRFGPEIATVANAVLDRLDADLRIVGAGRPGAIGPTVTPDVILCRTNAGAFKVLLRSLDAGQRPFLVGGGKEIAAFARAAQELQNGERTTHPELSCFETWGEVQDYVEFDDDGSDLRLLVELVDEYGVERILAVMGSMTAERDADVVISTAHKAKGREWDSVQLHSDFPEAVHENAAGKIVGREITPADLRLLYVSVTRARLALDYSACLLASELVSMAQAPRG